MHILSTKGHTENWNVLNKKLSSLCEWFIENKLSIHFGKDKTKAILFTRNKTEAKLNICFQNHSIKQYNCVEYLGCLLDNNLARRVFKKINGELKFLYRQAIFLNPACKRLILWCPYSATFWLRLYIMVSITM